MKKVAASLLLIVLVWALYAQTGTFEFLRLDDHDYTFRCPFVFNGLSWANVRAAFTTFTHAAIWMPVTYMSYMLGISLFGAGMGAHHLLNAAIHSVNAVLLWVWLRRMTGAAIGERGLPVLFAAAFWAVHPQRVEAVAWIAARKELLCALFVLGGLICWTSRRRAVKHVGAFVCGALACLSKPTAMCFPFLLLAQDWFAGKVEKKHVLSYLPSFLLAVATGAVAVYSQTHAAGYAVRELFSAPFGWRLLNAAVAVGLDVGQCVWPFGIHLDYRAVPGAFPIDGVWGLVVFVLVCAALAGCAVRRNRRALACALFFAAALAPTLGVFGSFGVHARADRFLYIPMMAAALGMVQVAQVIRDFQSRPRSVNAGYLKSGVRTVAIVAGVVSVLALMGISYPLVGTYRNDFTAFSRALACDPDHPRALAHVASEQCARFGKIDKGIELFRRSQQLEAQDGTAAQLAYALAMRGNSADHDEVRRLTGKFACDHALDRKGMALEARGLVAMRQRRWDEAIACFTSSIKAPLRFYSAEDAKLNLAACVCNAGRKAEAEKMLQVLTQSPRADIRAKALQALDTLRASPGRAYLFF